MGQLACAVLLEPGIRGIQRAQQVLQDMSVRERAQGLVEYGLIIALVAVLAIAGLIVFGPAVRTLLSRLGGSV